MTVFTVHVTRDDAKNVDDMVFVPERFSWGAFLLTPLWLLWHRLWFSFLIWGAVMASVILATGPLSPTRGLAYVLVSLLCGFEGFEWVREKLARHDKEIVDLVTGDSLEDAETHFYYRGGLQLPPSVPPPLTGTGRAVYAASDAPFGVFPHPENRS
jgi:hypothetical protein